MKAQFYILIFVYLFLACSPKGEVKKTSFSTIKTYLKEGDKIPKLFRVEKFDTTGKCIEIITYDEELIGSVVRIIYDSINQPAIKKKVFPGSGNSRSELFFLTYNDKRLLIRQVGVECPSTDSIYNFFEYDPKNRLTKIKTITKLKNYWNGILEYHYNESDSLYLIYEYDLNMNNRQLRDSIVYYNDLKIEYKKTKDSFYSKTIFYKNQLRIREIDDYGETNYSYDVKKRVIKKEELTYHPGGLLDAASPSTIDIYTYEYE